MEKLHLKTLTIVLLGLFVGITLSSAMLKVTPKVDEKPESGGVHFINPKKQDGGDKLFSDVIKEFEGKVIYVDFWASWCPPCRQQMPHAKVIHEDYEGKDVVFLYISFDRTEGAWKNGINKYGIQGHHILPTQTLGSDINNKFKVTGIPRYLLIDKTGKVVDRDAPRPSQVETLKSKINALL